MAKLQTKHFNEEVIEYVDFSGGLNLAKPPEGIAMNEMQEAVNIEFSAETGLMKVRGGLEPIFEFAAPVRDIFPVAGGDACLVRAGNQLYRVLNGVAAALGQVDGDLPGMFEYFGENGDVIMVFGGKIYIYNDASITMTRVDSTNAPTACTGIFYKDGRVAVTQAGIDEIWYSGFGDPELWTESPTDPTDAQWIRVGYKDGCQMQALGNMVGETIVFKCPPGQPDNGRIYRLQGSVGNWNVVEYSKGASAWNSNAVTIVANNMLFLTREGMSSLATAMEYGDFRLSWAGAKINPRLSLLLTNNCRLWHLPIKGQVWAWDGQSAEVWVYHYQIGDGAWTTLKFPTTITAAAAVNSHVYIGMGNTLYELVDSKTTDSIFDENGDEADSDIKAVWMPKTLTRANQILVKRVRVNYLSTITSEPFIDVEGLKLPLPVQGNGDIAYSDDDIASMDTDPLIPDRTSMYRRRCNIVRWDVTPKIEVTNGLFSLSAVALNICEV